MVLLQSKANERSCINYNTSLSPNLEKEKSEKDFEENQKRLNLAKGCKGN